MPSGDNPNSRANLKPPFSATNQPKKRGRKPSKVKKYIKDNNLSADDMSALAKYCMPLSRSELVALAADEKTPVVVSVFARALLDDIKNGNPANTLRIMDRAVGKPKETVETKVDVITIGAPPAPEQAEFPEDDETKEIEQQDT